MDSNELKAVAMIGGPGRPVLIGVRPFHFVAPNAWETSGVVGAPS